MTTTKTTKGFGSKMMAALLAVATALGLAVVAAPGASAQDNPNFRLRGGCTWASDGPSKVPFYVQNCDVWSPAMGQNIKVQIKPAAQGGDAGLYLLDGLRARDDWNAWGPWGGAPEQFVNDNVTLVMPVGGQAQFYTDWIGPWDGTNGPRKPRWETFLTAELPDYLQKNFGVSKTRNGIVGLSMGGTAAMNLAAHHRDQFKQVTSLSGYLNPTWPGMYAGIEIAMLDSAGPGARIWDMWGNPLDLTRFRNDPLLNTPQLSGIPMYISASAGVPEPGRNFLADPLGTSVGVGLEWMARTSTAKFELAARATGSNPVTDYPITGIHDWPLWKSELVKAKPHIQAALGY